jgi:hypothetical protein
MTIMQQMIDHPLSTFCIVVSFGIAIAIIAMAIRGDL